MLLLLDDHNDGGQDNFAQPGSTHFPNADNRNEWLKQEHKGGM
jgi:hypothetical protein